MKKILQIDGGGLKGIIPAVICNYIEKTTKKKINQIFDLMSGTSTGSILTAMYAAGVPAEEVMNLYIKKGSKLFKKKGFFSRWFSTNKAKYDRSFLLNEIKKNLKEQNVVYMKDLPVDLALTAFGLYANRTHYICSWKAKHSELDISDVVAWSALSAANYFGKIKAPDYNWECRYQEVKPEKFIGEVFQDGGQGTHNCTAEDSLRSAIYAKGYDDIYLLSLGCGAKKLMAHNYKQVADDGWWKQVTGYLFQARAESTRDQVHNSWFIQKKIYNNEVHFKRVDPVLPKSLDKLDGLKYVKQYVDIGENIKYQVPQEFLS
jgi:patatin-like phospholipase/acyl hydrolase